VGLFENAMSLRFRGTSFSFEKDIYPLLMRTLDVYWLARKRPDKIHDAFIRTFKHLDELEEYAEEMNNFQLQGMIQIVERYAADFPDIIFEMADLTKERQQSEPQEGIILSTIHSAKGQEYDQVYIDADMAENLDVVIRNELEHVTDEVNIAYVGFTRAMQRLYLPHEFQDVLTPKWTELLKRYQTPPKKKQKPGEKRKSTKKQQPSKKTPVTQPEPKVRPGDRVRTLHGPGIVLEISGDYCLIDLANREVKLRERLSNIRV
jgi:superfamily I DNA/RNA helicase